MTRASLVLALAMAALASGCATKSRCECCAAPVTGYSTNYGGTHQ